MLRLVIIILFALISSHANAWMIGIGQGGLTPHYTSLKKNYCNQWNDSGVIYNKSTYITVGKGNWMVSIVNGNDSICSPIKGMFVSWGFFFRDRWDMSVVFGAYEYDQDEWDKHDAENQTGIQSPTPTRIAFNDFTIAPVLALGIRLHLIKGESWSLILNNLITPIITNHSLMVEWRFSSAI
jgi:hypothetical protein